MRILIATTGRGLAGGVERYLQSIIPALTERGHSIGLLYEYPFRADTNDAGGESIDSQADDIPSWCSIELGVDSVLQSIHNWAPDVVYSHGLDDGKLERALLDSYRVAMYVHTYYGTCVSGRKCFSSPRLQPCNREFGAACLALYYPRRCGGLNPRTMVQLYAMQSNRKSTLPDYQAILVASEHMSREYERHGVSPERLHLVPLPIDGSDPAASVPRPRALGYRILVVGRLIDVKGVDHLIQAIPLAAAKLGQTLKLTVAGDGPDRAKLEDLARSLALNVEFAGWVNTEQRSALFRQTDLVAVPSLWPEPFGMVGAEAGCFGVPAVGYAVGGIPDWLIPGQSGEIAQGNPPTIDGLAEAIVRAFADPAHHQKLRLGAWEMARRYTLERHLAQLEPLLTAEEPVWRPTSPAIAHP